MKLCVPTTSNRGLEAVVADHFGSAPYFTMIDLAEGRVQTVTNPACGHEPGACHHVDILRAHHVQAVACAGIGRRALAGIEQAGIRVLAPRRRTVAEIVEAVRRGEVEAMTIENACEGHGDGRRRRHRHRHRHGHAAGS